MQVVEITQEIKQILACNHDLVSDFLNISIHDKHTYNAATQRTPTAYP
jgi:hypothetical protein